MKKLLLILLLLPNLAFANYGVRYMWVSNVLYFSDGYWQLVHQEAIIDYDGIQFIHIGE